MLTLRIPNRSVTPADFRLQGICQNLDCLAPLEPPFQTVWLSLPGGTLETLLCAACIPRPSGRTYPEVRLEVVAAAPVLERPKPPGATPASSIRVVPASDLTPQPLPPPAPFPWGNRKRPPSFRALAKLEPRLRDLLAEARAHHKNLGPVFCANAVWYGYPGFKPGIKKRLCGLVGYWAERADLRYSVVYDVAYHTIYQALPDCRGRCLCSWGRRI
jgi:hypothetical protein